MAAKNPALDEDQLVKDMMGAGYGAVVRRRDVEKLLSISKEQAYLLLQDGQLESTRLGTHYRVPLRSIARYLVLGSATPPRPT